MPNQLSQRVGTNETSNSLLYNGVYIQDQWTRKRLTLQGAVRFESASSWAPAGENGILADNEFGGPFLLPRTEGVQGYHDITPRMGAAYDVFGTGKTALKVNVGQYLQGAYTGDAYIINNPGSTLVTSINRSWSDPNGNRVAECDFMNPAASGECGPWSANNWASFNQTTTVNPDVLKGWGTRNRDWQYGVSVQQQIAPQVGLEVSYNRRVWSNFFLTHNRALTAADYDEVTLTAPSNPLLPNGGGYPVTFLTRNTRSALGATDSYYTTSDDFGGEIALLARRGRVVQRAHAEWPEPSGRHQHGARRWRHLRHADRTVRTDRWPPRSGRPRSRSSPRASLTVCRPATWRSPG